MESARGSNKKGTIAAKQVSEILKVLGNLTESLTHFEHPSDRFMSVSATTEIVEDEIRKRVEGIETANGVICDKVRVNVVAWAKEALGKQIAELEEKATSIKSYLTDWGSAVEAWNETDLKGDILLGNPHAAALTAACDAFDGQVDQFEERCKIAQLTAEKLSKATMQIHNEAAVQLAVSMFVYQLLHEPGNKEAVKQALEATSHLVLPETLKARMEKVL